MENSIACFDSEKKKKKREREIMSRPFKDKSNVQCVLPFDLLNV